MRDDDYLWDPRATPDPEVARLEEALRPARWRPVPFRGADAGGGIVARAATRPALRWAVAAASLFLAALGARAAARALADPWAVTALSGAPVLGDARLDGAGRLTPGAWLRTDAASRARITVGRIGRADVGPDSRVRLVRAAGTEHRLALARGTMHARIWAPPRFFLVETPSALAVDLGCVYTLTVDDAGAGVLRVESGQVELVEGTRRALVLAGNAATLRPGVGPGLPYPVAAPAAFRAALLAHERAPGDPAALDALLAASSAGTTTTLWHLLGRVDGAARERVHARLAALAPPPAGVTHDAVLRLDRRALDAWREALEPTWTTESVSAPKRLWRRVWMAVVYGE